MNKRLFSASELAELKLPGMATSRENAARWISKVAAANPELVAERQGRGGGWLVDFTALPEAAQAELKARETKHVLAMAEAQADANALELAQRRAATAQSSSLTARQIAVRDARHSIIIAITAEAAMTDTSREKVILRWCDPAEIQHFSTERLAVIRLANDRVDDASLSYRTLHRWFAAHREEGLSALAPKATGQAQKPDWLKDFWKHYALPSKPSAEDALRAYTATLPAGEKAPSIRQVRYRINNLNALQQSAGRKGQLALRAMKAYKSRDFADLMPTMIFAADGKKFDAEIEHPFSRGAFRPEISTIIDVATRRAVGWSVSFAENTFAVVDALRHACSMAGIPAIFYTDRGPGYKNKRMNDPLTGFLSRAGITAMHALPYNSQAKGVIERLNQVYTAAAKVLPTYIGKDMDKEASQLAHKQSRFDLRTTGSSRLLMPWDDFLSHIDTTLANYNNRPHSSLPKFRDPQLGRIRHMTPNELWAQKLQNFEPVIADKAEFDDMWRPYELRKTRRGLVELRGNEYFAKELVAYFGKTVAVGFDIHDGSKVWVRELDELDGETVPGKLVAIAEFSGNKVAYAPVSFQQYASDKREQAQLKRLEKAATEIRAQRSGQLIELAPEPAPIIPAFDYRQNEPVVAAPLTPSIPASTLPVDAQVAETATGEVRRPWFDDDVSFANWLVSHPDQATDKDKVMLRDLLTTHSTNELLRMSGVDLTALRSIVRSPTVPSGASNGDNT